MTESDEILYRPSQEIIDNSNMTVFMKQVQNKYGIHFHDYHSLHRWSVENLSTFWKEFVEFSKILFENEGTEVLKEADTFHNSKWFENSKINFAKNLLRFRDEKIAIYNVKENGEIDFLSYAELYNKVHSLQLELRKRGLKKGDRVAAYIPNCKETVIAMLAVTSLGGIWSSASPDFATQSVIDRFSQIEPTFLFTANAYSYRGKTFPILPGLSEILHKIPSIQEVFVVDYLPVDSASSKLSYTPFSSLIGKDIKEEIEFAEITFQDPVYIMYSSGTTGLPKCIVQGAGVLINHLKEHILHTDLKREDVIFYFSTCGWMMWNWLVSALGVGASLVLFDGNPFYPQPSVLWKLAEKLKITVFGTSAKYIAALDDNSYHPAEECNLDSLRCILSTGSPLLPENFDFVYKHIKKNVQLSSISGGTDLNGCFALGNPILPVLRGELQCRGLGMDVEVFDEEGNAVKEEKGELVCKKPFPSMPLYFWNDPDKKRYLSSYFSRFENIWCHGDFAELSRYSGMKIYGRSDATLNPGGVRIGYCGNLSCIR